MYVIMFILSYKTLSRGNCRPQSLVYVKTTPCLSNKRMRREEKINKCSD